MHRLPLKAAYSLSQLWSVTKAGIASITQPVLLFRSLNDHVVEPSNAAYILANVSSADVTEVVLPGGGRGFTIRGPNGDQSIGGYEVKQSSVIEGQVARFSTQVRSLTPEIPASEIETANRGLRALAAQEFFVRAPK